MNNVSIVIPARFSSQRFPGKMIHPVLGKPLIVRVYENIYDPIFGEVLVLTDDKRIADILDSHQVNYLMTSAECKSGTDRIASVIQKIKGDYIINVQGDEPLVTTEIIQELAEALIRSGQPIATLARRESDQKKMTDPNIVKVVLDHLSNALYFSRSLIPFPRESAKQWLAHVGIYGYTRKFLENFAQLADSEIENVEKLEQLGFLFNGFKMHVKIGNYQLHGIDVAEDIPIVEKMLNSRQGKKI